MIASAFLRMSSGNIEAQSQLTDFVQEKEWVIHNNFSAKYEKNDSRRYKVTLKVGDKAIEQVVSSPVIAKFVVVQFVTNAWKLPYMPDDAEEGTTGDPA